MPADRHRRGNFPGLSVAENLALVELARSEAVLRHDVAGRRAADAEQMRALDVRAAGPCQPLAELSGGNQQKVLLGRWIRLEPSLLVLEEPTQGVDVGARRPIHDVVRSLAARGVSILLVSSDLTELLALCHRIGVMREGRLVAELDAAAASEEELLRHSLPEQRGGEAEAEARPASQGLLAPLRRLARRRETTLAGLIAALAIAVALGVPGFATWDNARDVLLNNAILLVGALGMTVVIVAGGIDISIGAILGLAATAAALADTAGWPGWAVAGAALGSGAALGAVNGTVSVLGRVHPIVVTWGRCRSSAGRSSRSPAGAC